MQKGNEGFTLVELMAGIVCVTLVIGAAMSMMLMGQRTNRALNDAVSEQQTARVITTMLEKLASEDSISRVEFGNNEWTLVGFDEDINDYETEFPTILSYSDGKITARDDDTVLMDGIVSSSLTLSEPNATMTGRLLNFTIATAENTYKTSVYCRLGTANLEYKTDATNKDVIIKDYGDGSAPPSDESITNEVSHEGRFKLLEMLCSQFGSSGQILNPSGYNYFSEWYIDGYNETTKPGWNANTPWCGCFVSWGVDQLDSALLNNNVPKFANVDSGRAYFEGAGGQKWQNAYIGIDAETNKAVYYKPTPGDFIFFSWDGDTATLEHVGAVFAVNGDYVYTIEGNSGGKVALHRYNATDSRIIGYGVLDWKTD